MSDSMIKTIELNGEKKQIREFDLNRLKINPTILVIGGNEFSKKNVCYSLMKSSPNTKNIANNFIISPTDKVEKFYQKIYPDLHIHHEYNPSVIQSLVDRQILSIKNKNKDLNATLLLDDCFEQADILSNESIFNDVTLNGSHHYKIMCILTMYRPLDIQPKIRGNIDYVFLMAVDDINDQKKIYEHYAGLFPNFESFRKIFTQLTDNNGCMVFISYRNEMKVDNHKTYDLFDYVFYFDTNVKELTKQIVTDMIYYCCLRTKNNELLF